MSDTTIARFRKFTRRSHYAIRNGFYESTLWFRFKTF